VYPQLLKIHAEAVSSPDISEKVQMLPAVLGPDGKSIKQKNEEAATSSSSSGNVLSYFMNLLGGHASGQSEKQQQPKKNRDKTAEFAWATYQSKMNRLQDNPTSLTIKFLSEVNMELRYGAGARRNSEKKEIRRINMRGTFGEQSVSPAEAAALEANPYIHFEKTFSKMARTADKQSEELIYGNAEYISPESILKEPEAMSRLESIAPELAKKIRENEGKSEFLNSESVIQEMVTALVQERINDLNSILQNSTMTKRQFVKMRKR
jgi:hypothetical protein